MKVEENNNAATAWNSKKIWKILSKHNKDHLSKVERSSTYDDKTYYHVNCDLARNRIVKVEIEKEDVNEKDIC